MSKDRISSPRDFDYGFSFISYGVEVAVDSDCPEVLDSACDTVVRAFGDRAKIFERKAVNPALAVGISSHNGMFSLYKDGAVVTSGPSEFGFFQYLNSFLRLEVAELAHGKVFLHAGVVGWNGQAIVFPGISTAGKSTLTAELVRNGALYYSDEYAVLSANARVGPFPRHLSLGKKGERDRSVPVEELGGRAGRKEIPVGMVLLTSYRKSARWKPEFLTPGAGIMEIIPHTLKMRKDPGFSLKVLDLMVQHAIIVKSPRGDVKKFAKFLLDFFDKHTKLAKMT